MIDWLFRNRSTGQITIAQFPNTPLWVFIIAWLIRWMLQPMGAAGTALSVISALALTWWAGDELVRGVNPWRRILGATALIVVGLSAVRSLVE